MEENSKIKTRQGSGYLKQMYSTARLTAGSTHSHLKNLTTFLVNFIPVDNIDASEFQMRTFFDDSEIETLAASVKEHGVLQPILVIQDGDRYKVIAGERRLRAARKAGMERIPARVLTSQDKASHEIALRENLDRVDLHPIEEGEGYLSLLEVQAYTSHESLAKSFGKPKSRVTECIGFTKLPPDTKLLLMEKGLSGRSLLRQLLNTPTEQHVELINKALALANAEQVIPITGAKAAKPATKSAKPAFVYKVDKKSVKVSGFKWKVGEGKEKLEVFATELRQLLDSVEKKLAEAKLKV